MALFGNSAEGGSNGVSVSTGNSGGASGNAWNAVVGGAAIAYTTSSPLKDSVSITESLSGGSAQYVEWTFTGTATAVARWYAQWSALPSASFGHMAFLAGSTRLVDIRVDTLGQIQIVNTSFSGAFTSPGSISTGTLYRFELSLEVAGAAGEVVLQVYAGDSTTPEAGLSTSGVTSDFGSSSATSWRIGKLHSVASATLVIDDIGVETDTLTLLGPTGGAASDVALTGIASAGIVGSVGVVATTQVALTGISSAGTVGTLPVVAAAQVALSSVASQGAVGTLSVAAAVQVSLTAVASQGAVGTAGVVAAADVGLSGVSSAGAVGTLQTGTVVTVDLTGITSAGAVGTLAVQGVAQVALEGVGSQGSVGTLAITAGADVALTGVSSQGALGLVAVVATVQVALSGVVSAGSVGTMAVGDDGPFPIGRIIVTVTTPTPAVTVTTPTPAVTVTV